MRSNEIQKIPFNHKEELYYCQHRQKLEQVAQKAYKVSILGDIQNLSGDGHENPAVAHHGLT